MSNYVKKNLLDGEEIIHKTHHHWVVFFTGKALASLFIKPIYDMLTTEFVITNKRFIFKEGWLATNTWEIAVGQLETIQVDRTLLGRIFGFGDITVVGSGGTSEKFKNISRPLTFRRKFQEATIN